MGYGIRRRLLAGLLLLAMILLLATIGTARATSDGGGYYALVIGNNDYADLPDLVTSISDAAAAAELLRAKYGFEVKLMLNATRADILAELNRLASELTEADRLLIYYAGHGVLDRVTETGYWLPVDAAEDDDSNWIPNDRLTRYLRRMAARHVMVVADSCFSGTLVREASVALRSATSDRRAWLERLGAKRARTAMVSGGLEPVADGGRDGHSVFASAFLQALRENEDVLEGHALFRQVRRQVILNADQTPQYANIRKSGHEGGDFLFVPAGRRRAETSPPAPRRPPTPGAGVDKEALFWQTIQASDDAADFRVYLAQFPDGTFARLARRRLQAIEARPGTAAAPAANHPPPAPAAPTPTPRQARAAPSQAGQWHLTVTVSSFMDGTLGEVEGPVTIGEGASPSTLADGTFQVRPSLSIQDGSVSGRLLISPGQQWSDISVSFEGRIDEGSFERRLSANSIVERGGFGRDSRDLNIHLRLERR